MKLIDRPDLQLAVRELKASCMRAKCHDGIASAALAKYGDHGPQISGVVRDHFPTSIKEALRDLARSITAHSDAGWKLRPKGVRISTMRKLSSEVAQTYGHGFYGPQP
jgi:hypothetical protein